jgi:co-chaperonin GroES (HSP10)
MLTPLKNKVLVRLLKKPRLTEGGIHLLAGDKDEPSRAVVKFIGEGVTEVKVEDVVMFDWNKATHVLWTDPDTFEKEDYWRVDIEDVIWVFEDYVYTDEDILT